MNKTAQLIRTGKSIFTISEITDIWNTSNDVSKSTAYRMVKKGNLFRLRRGFFSLTKDVNLFELGCKLVPGSYVSLFTVLKEKGVIFQETRQIYLMAERPKTLKVAGQSFEYHSIKNLLYVPDGISFEKTYSIAGLERALLEVFSLFDTDYSDFKISGFDRELFLRLSRIFNKRTQKKAAEFLKYISS